MCVCLCVCVCVCVYVSYGTHIELILTEFHQSTTGPCLRPCRLDLTHLPRRSLGPGRPHRFARRRSRHSPSTRARRPGRPAPRRRRSATAGQEGTTAARGPRRCRRDGWKGRVWRMTTTKRVNERQSVETMKAATCCSTHRDFFNRHSVTISQSMTDLHL